MILSDRDIKLALKSDLTIFPFKEENLQPASYDLTLGTHFLLPNPMPPASSPVSSSDDAKGMLKEYEAKYIILHPGECALATTLERVVIPDWCSAQVYGRSSWGRRWILIHAAGYVDPGFDGQLTLEIVNHSPWRQRIDAGSRIGQLVFTKLSSDCEVPYHQVDGSKYSGQVGATASRLHQDREVG